MIEALYLTPLPPPFPKIHPSMRTTFEYSYLRQNFPLEAHTRIVCPVCRNSKPVFEYLHLVPTGFQHGHPIKIEINRITCVNLVSSSPSSY